MRGSLWFAAALTAVVLPSIPADAAPRGSYLRSCRDIRDTGGGRGAELSAQCRDRNGRYRYSSLRYNGCQGDIGNNNGQLVCAGGRPGSGGPGGGWNDGRPGGGNDGRPGGGWNDGRPGGGNDGRPGGGWGGGVSLPAGSWASSCRNGDMRGSTLTAQCKGGDGWRNSQLDMRGCRTGRAGNQYGRLVCE